MRLRRAGCGRLAVGPFVSCLKVGPPRSWCLSSCFWHQALVARLYQVGSCPLAISWETSIGLTSQFTGMTLNLGIIRWCLSSFNSQGAHSTFQDLKSQEHFTKVSLLHQFQNFEVFSLRGHCWECESSSSFQIILLWWGNPYKHHILLCSLNCKRKHIYIHANPCVYTPETRDAPLLKIKLIYVNLLY